MPKDEVILTPQSKEKLEKELHRLRTVESARIAEAIRKARSYGDLSENFEYQAARREQAILNGRIAEIEAILARARVVEQEPLTSGDDVVEVGSTVTLLDVTSDNKVEFTIVDAVSADPLNQRISYNSPIGQALLHRKRGDRVNVRLPNGTSIVYEILELR